MAKFSDFLTRNKVALDILLCLTLMFGAAVIFRPLLPVDETRYLTVAWEMWLRQNHTLLTLNYEPYHHKPPLLFWLINLSWSLFGVSRGAAILPIMLGSCLFIWLTSLLARQLFPLRHDIHKAIPYMVVSSLPFIVFGTLVMFDIWVGVCVLALLNLMLHYQRTGRYVSVLGAGLMLGLGLLMKGPVIALYTLPALLFRPFWATTNIVSARRWYLSILLIIILSLLPLTCWLYPLIQQVDGDFSFWLIWNQTAGRITGNFSSAHARPFYFYLPFVPMLAMPWLLMPSLWRRDCGRRWQIACQLDIMGVKPVRFLLAWFCPTLLGFSLIAGKQIHYLLPLLPAALLLVAATLPASALSKPARITPIITGMFVVIHIIGSVYVFPRYDLAPVVALMQQKPDAAYAYIGKYHGQVSFLARHEKKIAEIDRHKISQWFDLNPDGYVFYVHRVEDKSRLPDNVRVESAFPFRSRIFGVLVSDKLRD